MQLDNLQRNMSLKALLWFQWTLKALFVPQPDPIQDLEMWFQAEQALNQAISFTSSPTEMVDIVSDVAYIIKAWYPYPLKSRHQSSLCRLYEGMIRGFHGSEIKMIQMVNRMICQNAKLHIKFDVDAWTLFQKELNALSQIAMVCHIVHIESLNEAMNDFEKNLVRNAIDSFHKQRQLLIMLTKVAVRHKLSFNLEIYQILKRMWFHFDLSGDDIPQPNPDHDQVQVIVLRLIEIERIQNVAVQTLGQGRGPPPPDPVIKYIRNDWSAQYQQWAESMKSAVLWASKGGDEALLSRDMENLSTFSGVKQGLRNISSIS